MVLSITHILLHSYPMSRHSPRHRIGPSGHSAPHFSWRRIKSIVHSVHFVFTECSSAHYMIAGGSVLFTSTSMETMWCPGTMANPSTRGSSLSPPGSSVGKNVLWEQLPERKLPVPPGLGGGREMISHENWSPRVDLPRPKEEVTWGWGSPELGALTTVILVPVGCFLVALTWKLQILVTWSQDDVAVFVSAHEHSCTKHTRSDTANRPMQSSEG